MNWIATLRPFASRLTLNISAIIASYGCVLLFAFFFAALTELHGNGFPPLRLPTPRDVEKACKALIGCYSVVLGWILLYGFTYLIRNLKATMLALFAMAAFIEMLALFSELIHWIFPNLGEDARRSEELKLYRCPRCHEVEQCRQADKLSRVKAEQFRKNGYRCVD